MKPAKAGFVFFVGADSSATKMFSRRLSSLILFALAACTSVTPTPLPTPQPTSTFTPQPTSTLQPTATVMPSATPNKGSSPTWLLPTIEVQDWHVGQLPRLEWVDNSFVEVSYWQDVSSYPVNIIAGRVLPAIIPTPQKESSYRLLSKSKDYEIACSDTKQTMRRIVDGMIISEAAIDFSNCDYIEWAPNNFAASLVSASGKVYVWRVDGSAPLIIGNGFGQRAFWSPDSSKMTVLTRFGEFPYDLDVASFSIVYPDDRPMIRTGAKLNAGNGWWAIGVRWLTNDVVWNGTQCGFGCYSTRYYDATSGDLLFGNFRYGQYDDEPDDLLSPDMRWVVLNSKRGFELQKSLALYDLFNRKQYKLIDGFTSHQLLRWSSNLCCFFFIRYPIDAQGVQVKEPAGLISFDASQMSPWLMIPNALDAQWNEQGTSVLVITFGEIDAKNKILRKVEAGVYNADGRKISSVPLAPEMRFDQLAYFTVPLEQSNSKNAWVVRDGLNNLWAIGDKGQTKQIASGLPVDESLNTTQFSWSPDDRYLLVYSNDRAWVVDMNGLK